MILPGWRVNFLDQHAKWSKSRGGIFFRLGEPYRCGDLVQEIDKKIEREDGWCHRQEFIEESLDRQDDTEKNDSESFDSKFWKSKKGEVKKRWANPLAEKNEEIKVGWDLKVTVSFSLVWCMSFCALRETMVILPAMFIRVIRGKRLEKGCGEEEKMSSLSMAKVKRWNWLFLRTWNQDLPLQLMISMLSLEPTRMQVKLMSRFLLSQWNRSLMSRWSRPCTESMEPPAHEIFFSINSRANHGVNWAHPICLGANGENH